MTPERWREVRSILHAAMELDVAKRSAYLDQVCTDDSSLRREVESLLVHEDAASTFLDPPAFTGAAVTGVIASQHALVGRRFGPYTVLAPIGAGGMGGSLPRPR